MAERHDEDAAPSPGVFDRLVTRIENWWLTRLLSAVSVFLIALTLIGFTLQIKAYRDDQLSRAWESLGSRVSGNTGKAAALEYVAARNAELNGLYLGAENTYEAAVLERLDLDGIAIRRSFFRNVDLWGFTFKNVAIQSSDFSRGDSWGTANGLTAGAVDFSAARLKLTGSTGVAITDSDLHRAALLMFGAKGDAAAPDLALANANAECLALFVGTPERAGSIRIAQSNISGMTFRFPEGARIDAEAFRRAVQLEDVFYFTDNPPQLPPELLAGAGALDRAAYTAECTASYGAPDPESFELAPNKICHFVGLGRPPCTAPGFFSDGRGEVW